MCMSIWSRTAPKISRCTCFKNVLMEDEFRDFADVGIVIQCYLHDAEAT